MELFSLNAKMLCYLYKNKHKNTFKLDKLSEAVMCNYFKTDNIIMTLGNAKYIKISKKDSRNLEYKIELTDKGRHLGKILAKIEKRFH